LRSFFVRTCFFIDFDSIFLLRGKERFLECFLLRAVFVFFCASLVDAEN
jgi:hypothetical protein